MTPEPVYVVFTRKKLKQLSSSDSLELSLQAALSIILLLTAPAAIAQQASPSLPESPSAVPRLSTPEGAPFSSSTPSEELATLYGYSLYPAGYEPAQNQTAAQAARQSDHAPNAVPNPDNLPLDAAGNPIPLNRQQPKRILGFFPNFRSVSAGAAVHPPGFRYDFRIATRQAFDYSSFIFLGITSLSAEGLNSHPKLGKGVPGFYAYTWRGLLDKTDTTYLSAWLLPSILHQDNRYFPLGDGHRVLTRVGYVISRQAVTRTYGGHQTFNLSGLGGKILAQYISRFYYPPGTSDFSVLATKFGYGAARDIGFQSLREFYPDVAAHYIRKHREKAARVAANDAREAGVIAPTAVAATVAP